MAVLSWDEEVVGGGHVMEGVTAASSNWQSRRAGFRRSTETVSWRPLISRVKYFAERSMTLKGPS